MLQLSFSSFPPLLSFNFVYVFGEQGFPSGSAVKNLPAIQETQVQSLDQEYPLEKKSHPASVFLPGKSHGQRSVAGYSP